MKLCTMHPSIISSIHPSMTSKHPHYDELSRSNILINVREDILLECARAVQERSAPSGTVLFNVGDKADMVYLIRTGSVRVVRTTTYGHDATILVLGPGSLVGELAIIDNRPRSAQAVCEDDCTFFVFPEKDFLKIFEADPHISQNVIRQMCSRLRSSNERVITTLEEQYYTAQQRFLRLNNLVEAAKNINSSLDLDKVLRLILDAAVKGVEADRGTLYLVDEIKKELWSKVLQGGDMIEIRLPMGKGIAGYVAETGETIDIADAYNDPRFNPEIDKKSGYKTNTMLCMPMKNKDANIIGVFQLLNKKGGKFDEDDEVFIDALSAHASVAIENARLAQEMVQSERLSAVGRMASTIIHDIKNPMGTLRVYAQVLKRKSGNEEAAKLADEMIRQVDRFVNMAQEILDFSRGVSSMAIVEVDFEDVMEGVLSFIEKDLEKHNIALNRKTDFRGKVKLDTDKLTRVFYNVVGNARDAMSEGGTITVLTAKQNGYVRIEFTDTGSGMPEEVRKRIFEPFMTHGKKHGTGLGMAIVKKVIDDHKGKIEIESELGKGTTIRILLPVN